jgi:hypothetical protein
VLDNLRALRQTYGSAGLRMVLTGSIGLHHVIAALKRQRYANSPLNDTYPLEVPPLDAGPAHELAAQLIDLLRLMEQDHYLSRDANGSCRFRFALLRRWWRLARGL